MRILSLLLFFFCPPCFAGGHVIGNGGDGLILNGQLFLRDLVEAGVEKHPYFGSETAPNMERRLKAIRWNQKDLPFEEKYLVSKLTDLEKLSPNLGYYISEAILSYHWVAVTSPLEEVTDPGYVLAKPPSENQVQIANRLGSMIRIHQPSWMKLNDENRATLIIHEAVYGLLKPVCVLKNQGCYQPAYRARNITGLLFTKSSFNENSPTIKDLLSYLDIPKQRLDLSYTERKDQYWHLLWIAANTPSVPSFSLSVTIPLNNDDFMDLVKSACKTYEEYSHKLPGRFMVVSTIALPPYEVILANYPILVHEKGLSWLEQQTRLSIRAREASLEKILYYFNETKEPCIQALDKHFQIAKKGS